MPLVSIVTPSYNSENLIENTILSVQSQTFEDYEHIVVDDCSEDLTVDLVKKYSALDSRVKLICLTKNSGAGVARNVGIEAARGRYITFLDSDDQWLPNKLRSQLVFAERKKAAFVFSGYRKIDDDGVEVGVVGVPKTVTYCELLKSNYIGCLTAMYDTKKIGKIYMPTIRKRQDLGLWLRLLKKVPVAHGQNESLAMYTIRKGSISSRKGSASYFQWRLYREVEKLSFISSCYYFSHYAVRGVLKTHFPRLAKILGVMHDLDRGSLD